MSLGFRSPVKKMVLYRSDRLSIQWSKWIGVTRSYSSTVDDDQQQQCICIQDAQKFKVIRASLLLSTGTIHLF